VYNGGNVLYGRRGLYFCRAILEMLKSAKRACKRATDETGVINGLDKLEKPELFLQAAGRGVSNYAKEVNDCAWWNAA
jgi:hypothetical protein